MSVVALALCVFVVNVSCRIYVCSRPTARETNLREPICDTSHIPATNPAALEAGAVTETLPAPPIHDTNTTSKKRSPHHGWQSALWCFVLCATATIHAGVAWLQCCQPIELVDDTEYAVSCHYAAVTLSLFAACSLFTSEWKCVRKT